MTEHYFDRPDVDELQALEEVPLHLPTIPVAAQGITRTQSLPARFGMGRTYVIGAARKNGGAGTNGLRFNADERRQRGTLISSDKPFYYGANQEQVEGGTAATWPANVILPIGHADEFWIASADAAGSTITFISENWAT